ncbi:acyl-CoA/acyl-ACP dehydrogenase [Aneurinibacillus sp. Ricciae_BoGa-3]|uniref:acyl-CoA dehydrogenase family protein n=1 Tax=Aneurinibacillus sp. Ricciae_BoGa-3 TaxID=3022697 RepID=UPI00234168A0|nr:acyl-CoA dehydrogenase family protein [Aneurinibacillus sp. Ricciae_BoGa-3]WCK56360.1 acyl-CoA/acyl-ACP dehydrogenase [Aneurinibacillus sp. Ricciae_BoGa-3]
MNDITQMLINSATKIMKDTCTKELINEAERGNWSTALWATLKEAGMITVAIPEELGGNGGSVTDALHILRLAGKYSAPIPLAETFLVNWLLANLNQQVSDEPISFALPYDNESFLFDKRDNGWVISGQASFVPWARYVKRILVFGQTNSQHVVALLSREDGKIITGQNLAGEARDTVVYEHRLVRDCQVIPVSLQNVKKQLWYGGAVARIVLMAGALDRVLEQTLAYSLERSQFGRPIHRFQAIQHQIALLAGEVAAAGVACEYAVKAYEDGLLSKEIAMAKIRINEAAGLAAAISHQVHGAIGFTYEHSLHHSTRRLWAWRDEFGTERVWGERLSPDLIEIGRDGLWTYLTGR